MKNKMMKMFHFVIPLDNCRNIQDSMNILEKKPEEQLFQAVAQEFPFWLCYESAASSWRVCDELMRASICLS